MNYIPRDKRKKILLICDDIRMTSGIATMAREIVIGTSHYFNWVQLAGVIKHPDEGKRLDLSDDTNNHAGIIDSNVILYPVSGYGTQDIIRNIINIEKPDAMFLFTDPRYFTHIFAMEHEIRQKMPIIYLNIWDNLPYPMYNKSYYESCDGLLAISKQTENINKVVLGEELASERVIKYVPHGINEKNFYPITEDSKDYLSFQEFKNKLFSGKKYDFAMLYNARNIRRKSVPDLLLAYKMFIDSIEADKAEKCIFVLHTQPIDENGTNLYDVCDMMFGGDSRYNIIFSESKLGVDEMRFLYNCCDVTALISSNEGWGLSLTESMMCGKPIIANVTGGMQDQMKFIDENGVLMNFNEEFGSNHRGKYTSHGNFSFPVYPSNISLLGSVPTPYIYDDRVSPEDVSVQILNIYLTKTKNQECYKNICMDAYKWATSDESMMSSRWMCNNIIGGINETIDKWEPRYKFELIQVETPKQSKHFNKFAIPI